MEAVGQSCSTWKSQEPGDLTSLGLGLSHSAFQGQNVSSCRSQKEWQSYRRASLPAVFDPL